MPPAADALTQLSPFARQITFADPGRHLSTPAYGDSLLRRARAGQQLEQSEFSSITPFTASHTLTIPTPLGGTYYVLVIATNLSEPMNFTPGPPPGRRYIWSQFH